MKILSKYKWFLIIIGIAVAAEIVWASQSLKGNIGRVASVAPPQVASITLSVPKTTFQVGEKIPVSININSVKATDGTDVILNYNPGLVAVSAPVTAGTIYNDYPLNTFDNTAGKISISGISSEPAGKVARGVLGTAVFEAKASGKAIISVDFTQGSTVDSNIIETKTAKDLLGKVGNVEVEIK